MSIESLLERIAVSLETIAKGEANVPRTKTTKSKTSSEPEPMATPPAEQTPGGFAGFPVLGSPAAEPPAVQQSVDSQTPANMPPFNMDSFLGGNESPNILDCPIKTREDFKAMLIDLAGHLATAGINPNHGIKDLLSRFGASTQSDVQESQFPAVYDKVQRVKGGEQI